jgi:hypothetical protein
VIFAAPESIVSGPPYRVIQVAGHTPLSIDEFIGDTSFVIERGDETHTIAGVGAGTVDGVRFYQKDIDHHGKDIRVWHIAEITSARFFAEHTAAI